MRKREIKPVVNSNYTGSPKTTVSSMLLQSGQSIKGTGTGKWKNYKYKSIKLPRLKFTREVFARKLQKLVPELNLVGAKHIVDCFRSILLDELIFRGRVPIFEFGSLMILKYDKRVYNFETKTAETYVKPRLFFSPTWKYFKGLDLFIDAMGVDYKNAKYLEYKAVPRTYKDKDASRLWGKCYPWRKFVRKDCRSESPELGGDESSSG